MKKIITLSILLLTSIMSESQSWQTVGSGLNNEAYVLFNDTSQNKLIIGGNFTYSGGVFTPFISTWDGTSYGAIGGGFNAPVRAIAYFNNVLYAGGDFTQAGGNPIGYLAKWDGVSWSQVDTAIDGPVTFLKENNGKLYISGDFTKVDTIVAKSVFYNGTSFGSFPVHYMRNYKITDIEDYNFNTYFAQETIGVRESNGFSYTPITGYYLTKIDVYALHVWNNRLYYAGVHHPGESSAYNLGYYDGSNNFYEAVQSCNGFSYGMSGFGVINDIVGDNNYLYAGGFFDEIGCPDYIPNKYCVFKYQDDPANVYSNNFISDMQIGMNDEVYDFEYYKGALYAVGEFTQAGSTSSSFISRWAFPAPSANFSTNSGTNICKGNSTSFSNTSTNATSYLWSFPGGNPSTSTLASPTVTYAASGVYDVTLIATGQGGNTTLTRTNYITVDTLPTSSVISYTNGVLNSNIVVGVTYKWYLNNQIINGETQSTMWPQTNGSYTLEITNSNGCSSISQPYAFNSAGINENKFNLEFSLFPNPSKGVLNVKLNDELFDYVITDVSGKILMKQNKVQSNMDVSFLSSGVYFIRIMQGDKHGVKSFTKQ